MLICFVATNLRIGEAWWNETAVQSTGRGVVRPRGNFNMNVLEENVGGTVGRVRSAGDARYESSVFRTPRDVNEPQITVHNTGTKGNE